MSKPVSEEVVMDQEQWMAYFRDLLTEARDTFWQDNDPDWHAKQADITGRIAWALDTERYQREVLHYEKPGPYNLWTQEGDHLVAEISDLEANGMTSGDYVILPTSTGARVDLREAAVDRDPNGYIAGWRFRCHGQDYLVIND